MSILIITFLYHDKNHENMTWSNRFSWKMTIFWRSPNFGQAFRELYWIILAYGNPPGSSYELFWHRKSMISNFRRNVPLVGQQLAWTTRNRPGLVPRRFFSSPKIEKTRSLSLFLYIQKFVKRMFENLFLRYFGRRIRFWYSEIISLLFRIDFMRFDDFDIMCPALTEKCSSRSSRIVTPFASKKI